MMNDAKQGDEHKAPS